MKFLIEPIFVRTETEVGNPGEDCISLQGDHSPQFNIFQGVDLKGQLT